VVAIDAKQAIAAPMEKYRKARDELIAELGKRLGGDALVVEV
jgi:hypothetical protein